MFDTPLMLNPGSRGGAAGAAFAGRVVGGLPGLLWIYTTTKDQEDAKAPPAGVALRFIGQVAGAAGGAAMAAPKPMRTRAAVGAAIGGAVPLLGAPLAALGAYVATAPRRNNNPSTLATAGLVGLGLLAAGGATYGGVKAYNKYKQSKALGPGNGDDDNLDEWGVDMDTHEYWGAGPVMGQDGNEYAYIIYHDLGDDSYWYMYKGAAGSGTSGKFSDPNEAAACVENVLPSPCVEGMA